MARPLWLAALLFSACTGFHEVRPGVFRSPQCGEDRLARRIEAHGIKTVVCLRTGEGAEASARATEGVGATFWRVPMSATRSPRPETLLELWRIAEHAERPLLVHCRAGADRTGLACALVVLHDTGDLAQAKAQLALMPYGHTGWHGTSRLDEVLERYGEHQDKLSFPAWVREVYTRDFERTAAVRTAADLQRRDPP